MSLKYYYISRLKLSKINLFKKWDVHLTRINEFHFSLLKSFSGKAFKYSKICILAIKVCFRVSMSNSIEIIKPRLDSIASNLIFIPKKNDEESYEYDQILGIIDFSLL